MVPLEDDEPHVIKEMLRYVHTAEYNDVKAAAEAGDLIFPPLVLHGYLHTVGDKCMIPGLCKLAGKRFVASAGDKWNTEEFGDAIAEIYAKSPDTSTIMHKTAVEVASNHAKELYNEDVVIRFREVASETQKSMPELHGTLVTLNGIAGKDEARYVCSICQGTFVIERTEANKYYRCPHPPCQGYQGKQGKGWMTL